jgi:hypothetical protein
MTRRGRLRKARGDAIAEWAPIAGLLPTGEQPRWSGDVLFVRRDLLDLEPALIDPDPELIDLPGHIWLTSARLIFKVEAFSGFPDGLAWTVPIGEATGVWGSDDWMRYRLVTVGVPGSDGIYSFRSLPTNLSRMLTHELFLAISEEIDRPRAATGH